MRRSSLLFDQENRPTLALAGFLRDVGIPGTSLLEIDAALQARFFQRDSAGKPLERWELQQVLVACPPDVFKEHLRKCGFIDRTKPGRMDYFYAAWPGALLTRAIVRLQDLVLAWEEGVRWECTVVFTGARPLLPDKENMSVAEKVAQGFLHETPSAFPAGPNATEFDMIQWVFKNSNVGVLRDIAVEFVNAPMKQDGRVAVRPSTEDPIQMWLNSVESNPPGSVLLSSGAPYCMAQDEAFWMLLEPLGFTVETFGHEAPDLSPEVMMREVAGAVNRIRRARLG